MARKASTMLLGPLEGLARVVLRRLHGVPGFTERAADIQIKRLPAKQEKIHERHGFDPDAAKDLGQIVDLLRQQRGGRSMCNIIGSGPSVLTALEEPVDPGVAYFTCNFGGLLPLPYDLYLLEVGSHDARRAEVSELQRKTIESLPERPRLILIKNIWESKLDGEYVTSVYPDALVCLDALFPFAGRLLESASYRFVFEKCFWSDTRALLQLHTSVLTLIQLAYRAGYTQIRVFGLDGAGPHFFHDTRIKAMVPVALEVADFVQVLGKDEKHEAGYSGRLLAKKMHQFLLDEAINLDLVGLASQGPSDALR